MILVAHLLLALAIFLMSILYLVKIVDPFIMDKCDGLSENIAKCKDLGMVKNPKILWATIPSFFIFMVLHAILIGARSEGYYEYQLLLLVIDVIMLICINVFAFDVLYKQKINIAGDVEDVHTLWICFNVLVPYVVVALVIAIGMCL